MSIKVSTKYVVLLVFLLILGIFGTGWYLGHKKGDRASQAVISALNDQINHYIVQIGDDSVFIAEKEQEIKTQKEAIRDGEIKREELRKLHLKTVNELTRANLRIDTLLKHVTHNGEIVVIHDTILVDKDKNCIVLPFGFNKKDHWLSLSGDFDRQGLLSVSLKMDVPIDLWVGISKDTKKPIAILTTKNSYIGVLSINSLKMDTEKVKRYGIGLQLGYGLTTQLKPTPYVGIGIHYSAIRF